MATDEEIKKLNLELSEHSEDLFFPVSLDPALCYRYPEKIGKSWHPCRDFIDILVYELNEWLSASCAGLDYTEPTTFERLRFILDQNMILLSSDAQSAAWQWARAWFKVHGYEKFSDNLFGKIHDICEECEALEERFEKFLPDDSCSGDDGDEYAKDNFEFQSFLVTIIEPFVSELRDLSHVLTDKILLQSQTQHHHYGEERSEELPKQQGSNFSDKREKILQGLEPAVQKAFLAYQYAETTKGRRLADKEAYDWLKENGVVLSKQECGILIDYKLPESYETFRRYVTEARKSLGENKYTRRSGRKTGGSIVKENEI